MSIPFYGKQFTFVQPDGRQIEVKGSGDQHHAVFETPEGYAVVKDAASGFYEFATLSGDGDELEPTGARAGLVRPEALGLAQKAHPPTAATRAASCAGTGLPRSRCRWEVRREAARMSSRIAAKAGMELAPPQRQTVGDFVGLCLLIQFPDVPGTITREEVEAFCNQRGYTGFGNHGSVHDYFLDNSGGKLRYDNIVTAYYTAKRPRKYYTNPSIQQPRRARELIKEALDHLKAQDFDFGALSVDSEDFVYAINVFYAGKVVNRWAEGLWPHCFHLATPYPLAPGRNAYDYQITNIGDELTLGTFCHENGHMLCDFPDLYDYGYESRGVGAYCLMCTGANVDPRNPTQIGAYLKYRAGWADTVTRATPGLVASLSAGRNDFLIHRRSSTEYYIIENRHRAGRDAALPGSGLAIWHVDELGSNNNEDMTQASHYECSLVQADNRFHLEGGANDGDEGDLFHAGFVAELSDSTQPASRWWDGSASGLHLAEIGPSGATMGVIVR